MLGASQIRGDAGGADYSQVHAAAGRWRSTKPSRRFRFERGGASMPALLRAAPGSDPGYALSLTVLAGVIPKGWRIPKVPPTEVGRNWALFHALCKRSLKDSRSRA